MWVPVGRPPSAARVSPQVWAGVLWTDVACEVSREGPWARVAHRVG